MTGPVVGRSRVLDTVLVRPAVDLNQEQGGSPVLVGDPESGNPSVIGGGQSGDPVDIGGAGRGSRPVWVGNGPPVMQDGMSVRDLYLDLATYDLYQLGG